MTYLWSNFVNVPLFNLGKIAPAQQDPADRIPLWIWIVGSLIVVLIGVLWTLREEKEMAEQARPATIPEPIAPIEPVIVEPQPVSEPEPKSIDVPPPKPDDLKKISGIGPKISKVLNEYGIYTFEQLAETDVAFLEKLMIEQEWQIADPDTWPDQARKLAEEKRNKQV